MASYVIHDVCGEKFLENINVKDPIEKKKIKEEHRDKIQEEKINTHFRNVNDLKNNIQLCDLKAFLNKYGKYMDNPAVFGYFFHLFTDNHFFKEVFDDAFTCLDKDGNKTDLMETTTQYKILKNNKIITPNEFWTEENIYGDYTKMNKLVLKFYGIKFNEDILRKALILCNNPGITEVKFENIESVIRETKSYIKDSETTNEKDLKIFDSNKIINFINEIGEEFNREYPQYVKTYKK